jgi:hypothetical protein
MHLPDEIAELVSKNDAVLCTLVKCEEGFWRRLTMENVRVAKPDAIKASLKMLTNRQVSLETKRDILFWLSSVGAGGV